MIIRETSTGVETLITPITASDTRSIRLFARKYDVNRNYFHLSWQIELVFGTAENQSFRFIYSKQHELAEEISQETFRSQLSRAVENLFREFNQNLRNHIPTRFQNINPDAFLLTEQEYLEHFGHEFLQLERTIISE